MIIGIVIDAWKLPVFRKHLEEGKWSYTEHLGPNDTLILKISGASADELAPIILLAQQECARKICPSCED